MVARKNSGKPADPKPVAKRQRKGKATTAKDELPVLSEDEKKKYKNQWDSYRVVIWFHLQVAHFVC